jgi:hypothetical protein
MADQLQLRRGTTTQNAAFTGAQGEVVVNTTNNTLVVHNGITQGGFPTAASAQVTDGTFYYNEDAGSAANAYILVPKSNTNTPSSYLGGIQFGFVSAHPNTGASTANFQSLGVKNLKYSDGTDPLAGDISGRVYLIYDEVNGWLEIQRKQTAPQPQIRTVGGSVATSAMTVTIAPALVDFRAATAGSGTVNRRNIVTQLSLTIPSGATLGTTSLVPNQIAILALDNAGTVQIGVVNISGNVNLDETTLVNCTAITSGSNSANVIYSSSSASSLPFRVMGYVQSTQATAGTWATTPSVVQGQGGQAIVGNPKMIIAPTQASTSGTSIDFTGIPFGTKRITVMQNGTSTNGTSNLQVQLGAGGIVTSGYNSSCATLSGVNTSQVSATTGFIISFGTATFTMSGPMTLSHMGGNSWVCSGDLVRSGTTGNMVISGIVTLTNTLDTVRFTTVNGTDTFDAGSISILYEG